MILRDIIAKKFWSDAFMKKIFLPMIFCLTMIFSSANAQDIFATSKDGYDYYVITETINERNYTTTVNGKNYPVKEVTVNVKKVYDGALVAVQHWRFASINYRTWQYTIDDTERGGFYTVKDAYAMDILKATGKW